MAADPVTRPRTKDRELLRQAGEHLGMLAEQAKESYEMQAFNGQSTRVSREAYMRYVTLVQIARNVLEVANG